MAVRVVGMRKWPRPTAEKIEAILPVKPSFQGGSHDAGSSLAQKCQQDRTNCAADIKIKLAMATSSLNMDRSFIVTEYFVRWVRCEMVDRVKENILVIDVLTDIEDRVVPNLRYFGEWKSLGRASDSYPLVILPQTTKNIDLGKEFREERYETMEFHGKRVREGDEFVYGDPEDEKYFFTVTKCANLIEVVHQANLKSAANTRWGA